MYSQSLLSYSINYQSKSNIPSSPILLPPLNFSSTPKITGYREVLHPPATFSARPHPFSQSQIPSNVSHFQLTEKNLVSNNYCSGIPSPPKSISSIGSISPVSLPSLQKLYPSQLDLEEREILSKQESSVVSTIEPKIESKTKAPLQTQAPDSPKKRRQRAGPSCDSCRQRKVKCNSEIHILSTIPGEFATNYQKFNLSESELSQLLAGQPVNLENSVNKLIIQNQKLVKYNSCKSCANKQLPCCFSKGFTKEDIIYLAKKSTSSPTSLSPILNSSKISKPRTLTPAISNITAATATDTPNVVIKKSIKKLNKEDSTNRKSSCNLCRQRKVKCIFNEQLGKCEGCNRKNKSCSFDC